MITDNRETRTFLTFLVLNVIVSQQLCRLHVSESPQVKVIHLVFMRKKGDYH